MEEEGGRGRRGGWEKEVERERDGEEDEGMGRAGVWTLLILQCEDELYVGSYSVPLGPLNIPLTGVGGELPPLPPGGHRCGWEIPWHIGVINGEDTGENGAPLLRVSTVNKVESTV